MHIPENYLSPETCAVMAVAMVPVWVHAVKKVSKDVPKEKMPLLGIGAAFSFLGMMFNIPLPGGTTGHAVGGTLIALLLGPDAACIAVTIALLVQALLFGDGGVLAFGANCFNMAFLLPYLGHAIYHSISAHVKGNKGQMLGAAVGSYVGINAAALAAAIEFGLQPYLFHDAAGQPLYCPYGLSVSIPAMMIGHLTIAGLAEVVFTTSVLAFLRKTEPGLMHQHEEAKNHIPMYLLLAALIIAVPLGLLAEGTAWGEWGTDEIAEVITGGTVLGYTPKGMLNGWEWHALMPDYSLAGLPDWVAYVISAIIGVAISILLFRLIAATMKSKPDFGESETTNA